MKDRTKLALVRVVHTLVYLVMAASVVFIVVAGLTRHRGPWLTTALILIAAESVVFVGNRMRCPLTTLAQRYGAGANKGYAFDTFLPEAVTRHTFRFFGALLVVGLVLLAINR